jgi:membrane-associated protein
MTLAGYFLGSIPIIQRNFEAVVLLIIFVSVLPVLIGAYRHWRHGSPAPEPVDTST